MKKGIISLLIITSLLCNSACNICFANSLEKKELIVGFSTPFAPFQENVNGELVGYDVDVMNYICSQLNLKPKYIDVSDFMDLLPMLFSGEIDCVTALGTSEERMEKFDFTRPYYVGKIIDPDIPADEEVRWSIAFPKESKHTKQFDDIIYKAEKSGVLEKIASKYNLEYDETMKSSEDTSNNEIDVVLNADNIFPENYLDTNDIIFKSNITGSDINKIMSKNDLKNFCYILDRWNGYGFDYFDTPRLAYEFVMQQLCLSFDNFAEKDPKGILNWSYYANAEDIDTILKNNFNINDEKLSELHRNVYYDSTGAAGYYHNGKYYFNAPEGGLPGSLHSIEVLERKGNFYKIKFVNDDLRSYGVDDSSTRDTYYCIFEMTNTSENSYKIYNISRTNNITLPQEDRIKVVLNGKELEFDQPPVMLNDRVMVPIRAVTEKMGDTVKWSEKDNSALIINPDRMVVFKNNHKSVIIAKEPEFDKWEHYDLDVPAQIVGNRTLTPVRAIGECLGAKVEWDGETQTVKITSNKNINKTITDEKIIKFNAYYSLTLKDNFFAKFSPEIKEFYESRNGWGDAFIIWWDDWFIGVDNLISGEENNVYMIKNCLAEIFSELPDNKEINMSTEIEITNWLSSGLSYLSYVDFTKVDKVVNISPHTANALSKFGNALDKAGLKLELTGVAFETICKMLCDYTIGITYIDLIRETLREANINDEIFYKALDNLEKEYTNKIVSALADGAKDGVIVVSTVVIGEVTSGAFTIASFSKDTINAILGWDDKADAVKNLHCIYWFNEYIDKVELSIRKDVDTKPEKIEDYIRIFNLQKIIKKKLYQSMDMLKNSKDEYTVNRIQEQLNKINNMSYIVWK